MALIDADGALTYGSLLSRASALALGLRASLGIGPGDRVGVLCRNDRGFVLSVVALSLLGADAVLVNTGLSSAQIAAVVRDHGLRLVIHDSSFEVPPGFRSMVRGGAASLVEGPPLSSHNSVRGAGAAVPASTAPDPSLHDTAREAAPAAPASIAPDHSLRDVAAAVDPSTVPHESRHDAVRGAALAAAPPANPDHSPKDTVYGGAPAVHPATGPDHSAQEAARAAALAEAASPAVFLDASLLDAVCSAAPVGVLSPPARPGRTVVLTSGTTGTPKGARRPNPGGLGPLVSILDRIPVRARSRILIAAPLFHTWGYAALQMAFGLRATVVLAPRFTPESTADLVRRHECAAVFAVPVMLERLLEAGCVLPGLRVVAVSGSALPGDLATRFMDANGEVLYNLYGSTEVSWASVATPAELRRSPRAAGRPPHGTQVAILSPSGAPVPAGTVGRIFVGNEMLFEGYAGGASPVESRDGLLATGDLGVLDASGLLTVSGREDDMVISGGENVFPSSVEDLLAALPPVREVAVVGVADEAFGQRLAAFVVLHPGASLSADEVRSHARQHGARFAVPRDVHFVAALPRTATGKVIKGALRS
ncbi:acyl-CoA synthetase (AMP-forming)/AMP-acid ligase II [Asanoa ferruginea]|uniref:Acyl-CoA synthetase (AMP-forming)/AMP-acid ligase II n=1 Tax=Asanoa ferruginea TaxID=53367 RepID=A0A3D9ZI14_9ACTN|nr:acyl-CoA synthetase (AMP-forming)/AMP-acid ligase II [Asanoa ferruginea]GIF48036.1 hypothetical protein Afe04nite_25750 [Asanoa ferruginea]